MATASLAKARWRILSHAVKGLNETPEADQRAASGDASLASESVVPISVNASRRPRLGQGFGLIPGTIVSPPPYTGEVTVEYLLPSQAKPSTIRLSQRGEGASLREELVIAQQSGNDSTGIVGVWPAEEVLAYYCIQHPELFRGKTVVELGAGCGLAGMAVAACTEAKSVLLTDGNPRVVSVLLSNVEANRDAFGATQVGARLLHWDEAKSEPSADDASCLDAEIPAAPGGTTAAVEDETYDVVIAADCTFFHEAHVGLAHTVRRLLAASAASVEEESRALLFNPRRGKTLGDFLARAAPSGLDARLIEHYDDRMSTLDAQHSAGGESPWPGYDREHCYPILSLLNRTQTAA